MNSSSSSLFQLSYWEHNTFFSNIDYIVLGSGIVGLNAAWGLKKRAPKSRVVIIERGFLPYGASTRNAGFACFGSISELLSDIEKVGEESVMNLVERRIKGLELLRKNLGDHAIDFQLNGGYEIFMKGDEALFERCLSSMISINNSIKRYTKQNETYVISKEKIKEFGFENVGGMIWNRAEGQLDTGLMVFALMREVRAAGVEIINGLNIEEVVESGDQVILKSDKNFEIKAKKVIVASNGFARELMPQLEVNPARAQVLITSVIPNLPVLGTFHFDEGYYYFRNIHNRILFGGGRNLAFEEEKTMVMQTTELIQNQLEHFLKTVILPNTPFEIEKRWTGIMGLGDEKKPIIKMISPKVFCAVRMGGMGVAIGSLVGDEVADMVVNS